VFDVLAPDGFLYLGAAETTLNLEERFVRLECSRGACYRKVTRLAA
jgi:chemotaxis methyl-accepting protein methylase